MGQAMTGYESKKAMAQDKLDSMEREALKLALEEYLCREMPAGTVIGDPKFWVPRIATAIKEALAQPAQEPVANDRALKLVTHLSEQWKAYALELQERLVKYEGGAPMLLNTTPPQRTWVGLTDEEIDELHGSPMQFENSGELKWVRIIEAKLKEKNNG